MQRIGSLNLKPKLCGLRQGNLSLSPRPGPIGRMTNRRKALRPLSSSSWHRHVDAHPHNSQTTVSNHFWFSVRSLSYVSIWDITLKIHNRENLSESESLTQTLRPEAWGRGIPTILAKCKAEPQARATHEFVGESWARQVSKLKPNELQT